MPMITEVFFGSGCPMSKLVRLLVAVVALGVGAAVVTLPGGCSSKPPPGAATVRGRVTFQYQPVAGGLVVFSPDPDRGGGGKPARGDLALDGTFRLKYGDDTAIPPGWYRVAIAPAPAVYPAITYPDRPVFPPQLARPDKSGLVREVQAGQENVFEFAVEVSGG
jgi:hypothetical protein